MNNYLQTIISGIKRRSWMTDMDAIKEYASVAAEANSKATQNIAFDDFYTPRKPATMDENGIAYIHITGMLLDEAPPIVEKLGIGTTYGTLIGELEAATEADAKGILLITNSPGGTVSGCAEATSAISNCGIPVMGYCTGMACSAAYKLVSQSTNIIASPSAQVGNIGTILSWVDDSQFWESMGIEFKTMTNEGADYKSTFHQEPNAQQLAFLQDELNAMGEDFKNAVTTGRANAGAMLDDEVFKAGWYYGQSAENLGLIDGIGTLEDARLELMEMASYPIDIQDESDDESIAL